MTKSLFEQLKATARELHQTTQWFRFLLIFSPPHAIVLLLITQKPGPLILVTSALLFVGWVIVVFNLLTVFSNKKFGTGLSIFDFWLAVVGGLAKSMLIIGPLWMAFGLLFLKNVAFDLNQNQSLPLNMWKPALVMMPFGIMFGIVIVSAFAFPIRLKRAVRLGEFKTFAVDNSKSLFAIFGIELLLIFLSVFRFWVFQQLPDLSESFFAKVISALLDVLPQYFLYVIGPIFIANLVVNGKWNQEEKLT